jgi:membrane associated rhomboid family serine protease
MAEGSRICPQCGGLNGIDEKTCHRCGKSLPGPLASSARGFFSDFSADGLPATKFLAGLCIVAYALCMLSEARPGAFSFPGFQSFRPETIVRFGALVGEVLADEPWRLLSAMFIHSSLLHIGMNLLGIVSLSRSLEPHLGSARFTLLYVLSGVLGYVATFWWRGDMAFSVGASGSFYGLLGAFIGALIVRRNPGWQRVFFSNLILAVALGSFANRIDHAAHIGGFVSGLVIGLLLELERNPRRRDGLMAVLAGVCVVASLASIVLSVTSPFSRRIQEAARQRSDFE